MKVTTTVSLDESTLASAKAFASIQTELNDKCVYIELQTVSARVRDLRKAKYGAHIVDRRYVGHGVWEYRLGKGAR
jgi:putative component of toxin-antitoxin plasmid stabilization module